MSQPSPALPEPPVPTPEQLAEWRALVERIRLGDRSEVVSWDQAAAELRVVAVYEVLVTTRVRDQVRDAPAALRGHVTGMSAVLRVDPTTASSAFQIRQVEDVWMVTFGAGFGFLTYQALEPERIVVLLDLNWVA